MLVHGRRVANNDDKTFDEDDVDVYGSSVRSCFPVGK